MGTSGPVEALVQGLSVFNTIALLWLGLTVLLNAERRTWGSVVAGGGLVVGGLFVALHATLVGRPAGTLVVEPSAVGALSWLPLVAFPYLWYLVMAWYARVTWRPWHRSWLVAGAVVGLATFALLFALGPPPRRLHGFWAPDVVTFGGQTATVLLYPLYSTLCILFALAALRAPDTAERFMGDVARRRAQPWLVAAAVVLLGVTLAVTALVAWVAFGADPGESVAIPGLAFSVLDMFDLAITLLWTAVGVLVGRAVASYEIFTGKVLPRGGLGRQWRNSLILASSFGALASSSTFLPVDRATLLALAALITGVLYAVHSWRVYVDREASMARLRPFVSSEKLYDRLLGAPIASHLDLSRAFRALCTEVLGARVGFLIPLGPLAPLAGPGLAHPEDAAIPNLNLGDLGSLAPSTLCHPVDPRAQGGAVWAVPLWSARGLVGVLLLGTKTDDALYTQEEMELARATGERLIDTQASAEIARRLMALQRERLAESQVVDRRARRLLHDEVLPRIHAALLVLSGPPASASPAHAAAVRSLVGIHQEIAGLLRASPPALAPEVARLGILGALRQVIDVEFGTEFDAVCWDLEPRAGALAHQLPPTTAEVVFYAAREAIRNAARHARTGDTRRPLQLTVRARLDNGLQLTIEDDGVGLGGVGGHRTRSGQGLVLHSTMMAVIGGSLTAERVPGGGTRVHLTVPGAGESQATGPAPAMAEVNGPIRR